MAAFGWMQNKLNGKPANKKSNTLPTTNYAKQEAREEFSDWPQGLFSIGTFGNDDIKEITESQNILNQEIKNNIDKPSSSSEEVMDITPEEVGKLHKELTKLLSRKPNKEKEKELADLPLDRFLNCPSSLEVDRRLSNALCSDRNSDVNTTDDDIDIDRTISVIIGKCKEVMISAENNKKKAIGKKSISFLLKKMFVCTGGFAPAPRFRDTLQESRMEKILRTMLHKKMSSQDSYRASSAKKYLEGKQTPKKKNEEEETRKKTDGGGKWDKTDSEYIVLEI